MNKSRMLQYLRRARLWGLRSLLSLVAGAAIAPAAYAGGGPENVFLVVNSADRKSMAIANQFIELRNIPNGSVLHIAWPTPPHDTTLELFRDQILVPVIEQIKARGLEDQIDYIIYSSGFPYRVDTVGDNSWASITSLTYLYEYVIAGKLRMLEAPRSNSYARSLMIPDRVNTRGFRHRYGLDLMGERVDPDSGYGQRYYLSMMLGYTSGKGGNSLDEVFRYLKFAKEADFTRPQGTIYFVKQDDVRSTVRHDHFPMVIEELAKLGVKGQELQGAKGPVASLPTNRNDVLGAVVGYPKARWEATNSRILPGAIVENFTSYGGRLQGNHTQVMLTHFLRHRAVASSGTVLEPRAFLRKFPHPRLHVHYAKGCSVAESFYQSVLSPYQLLIVGDPLCQPWAVPPRVTVQGIKEGETVSGVVEINADVQSQTGQTIRNIEIYVDGRLLQRGPANEPIRLDTRRISDGHHELRVVAIEDTAVETQGRAIQTFSSLNLPTPVSDEPSTSSKTKTSQRVEVFAKLVPRGFLRQREPAYVNVKYPDASEIRLYRGRQLLGAVRGSSGRISVDASKLGGGPVQMQAIAFPRERTRKPVMGVPISVDVEIAR